MRLAISNIAWDIAEDEAVATLLHRYGIDAIDIAPGKYFAEPTQVNPGELRRVRNWWTAQGVEIAGMQSLLFGTTGLNMFGPPRVQGAMLDHLEAICRIGAALDAPRLVFGSPKNRNRGGLSDSETMAAAISFFQRLGDIAAAHGVTICLEPNPPCYGSNFMTTSFETASVVRQTAHPAIRMQLDTGALTINGEDPAAVLRDSSVIVGHIHASEPDLLPLGDGVTDHAQVAEALKISLPDHLVSIEMLATQREPHLTSIERALAVAIRHYRDSEGPRIV